MSIISNILYILLFDILILYLSVILLNWKDIWEEDIKDRSQKEKKRKKVEQNDSDF